MAIMASEGLGFLGQDLWKSICGEHYRSTIRFGHMTMKRIPGDANLISRWSHILYEVVLYIAM